MSPYVGRYIDRPEPGGLNQKLIRSSPTALSDWLTTPCRGQEHNRDPRYNDIGYEVREITDRLDKPFQNDLLTSLMSKARMIGAGKPKISLYNPSRNVFLRTGQKSGVLKTC